MTAPSAAQVFPKSALADVPFLVVNPNSANGATGRRWSSFEARARASLGELAVGRTTGPLDATRLTREALARGHRRIVAVGGDGTLNEVVNGFFDPQGQPLAPDATFSVLPQGTGGDFRRTLGLSGDFGEALLALKRAEVRPIDVGRIRFRGHDGAEGLRHFINVASVGISGSIADQVNRSSKRLGGYLTFMLASARALVRWRDVTVRLRIDGGAVRSVPITCVALANGQFFGGGMRVAPGAALDDGLFSGTIWSRYDVATFLFRQRAIYAGDHVRWKRTELFTARRVEIESDVPVLLDVDGEQPGLLPAQFEVLPGALLLRG
jgi:YegS/Rv2252/BmrU family lipid kinase